MSAPLPVVFDAGDKQSGTWRKLTEHLNNRLARLRQENDINMDENLTAMKRGQIAEIKALLSLGRDPVPTDD